MAFPPITHDEFEAFLLEEALRERYEHENRARREREAARERAQEEAQRLLEGLKGG